MTLPATGPMSFSQVATEDGVSNVGFHLNLASVRSLAGVGASGPISMSQLRGKSAASANPFDPSLNSGIGATAANSSTVARASFYLYADGTWNSNPPNTNGHWLANAATDGLDYEVMYTSDTYASACTTPGSTWFTLSATWQAILSDTAGFSSGVDATDNLTITIRKKSNTSVSVTFNVSLMANGACFAIGTLLRTPYGDRTVESLAANDAVASFSDPSMIDESDPTWRNWSISNLDNVDTGATAHVVKSYQFVADESIKINGIHSTLSHTYFVFDGSVFKWKLAKDITTADSFIDCNKNIVPIDSIEIIITPTTFVALDVENIDTLQVKYGDTYLLAHNLSA